jgi:hypothetical protein
MQPVVFSIQVAAIGVKHRKCRIAILLPPPTILTAIAGG